MLSLTSFVPATTFYRNISQPRSYPSAFCGIHAPVLVHSAMSTDYAREGREKPLVDRAVIVGGGLGGLAAAIFLRKVGIDVQVYERNSVISGGEGTLISLFPNGCKALNAGNPEVVQKLQLAGLKDITSHVLLPDGKKIGEWKLSSQMEEKFGQPMIAILWRDALKILSEAVPEHCKHTGCECIGVTQEEDGAIVQFKKGNETFSVKAPLVIGADGIRSSVRKALFGNIPPRDNGRTMWRAIIESSSCLHEALKVGTLASLFQGRTVFIVNGVQGKLYWALSVDDECCGGSTKIRSKTNVEAKERLLEYFKGWDLATSVIQATEPDLILERRVLDLPVLPTWSKGNTVLLGDAVHAVTPALGQGANLAYEDGMHLARLLTSCPNLRTAFDLYEEMRIPRVKTVAKASQNRIAQASNEFYEWLYNPQVPS